MSIFYGKKFYDRDYNRTSLSAHAIIDLLLKGLAQEEQGPRSVIDIGCGRGVWLKEFAARGVALVKGRDGPWVNNDRLLIPRERFEQTDLSTPFDEGRRYDLAMSLEVAEHIDAPFATQFVDNLVRLSDTIMFSAAIEGQGGQHHVNEQPLSYWAAKFARRGYRLIDCIRPHVWANDQICWWYRQNIVVFCHAQSAYANALDGLAGSAPAIIDVAHPSGFRDKARLANLFSPEEYVGLWLARVKRKFTTKPRPRAMIEQPE